MDTPTHALIGRLIARSVWPEQQSRALVNLVTVASLLPDLDVLIPGDALERLETHRGITHSLFGATTGALALAWIARRAGLRRFSFRAVYAASLFGLLLHIFFDVATSYGTMIFHPFSKLRVSLDVLFIIDPYLDVIVIGGLVLGWANRAKRSSGYRLGAVVFACYLSLNLGVALLCHHQVQRWSGSRGIRPDNVAILPTPFSPLHRRGLVRSGDRVWSLPLSVSGSAQSAEPVYASALFDARLDALWKTKAGKIYRRFARFPVVEASRADGLTTLVIHDLQFAIQPAGLGWLGSWAAGLALDHNPEFFDRTPFALTVQLDEEDRIRKITYRGGSLERGPED